MACLNHWLKRIAAAVTGCAVLSASSANLMSVQALKTDLYEPNFAKALQYSMYFYDANMCGTEVAENTQYRWRGNCHTYDAELLLDSTNTNMTDVFIAQYQDVLDPDGDGCVDVSGGYHDAGDHVKFGLPEAYTASTLAWGYYEFRDAYVKIGQQKHIETILKYAADYFMRCTFRDANGDVVAFCYQVGDGEIDHSYWQSPEIDSMFRPGWFATAEKPTTDVISNTAAALAAIYVDFKDTDAAYAETCLEYAKALFAFAEKNDKAIGASDEGPEGFYSSNKWEDDYCWGAAWLYMATQDIHYLEEAANYLDYYAPKCWVHCWNDVWGGAMCILAEIQDLYHVDFVNMYRKAQNKSEYEAINLWGMVGETVDAWMTGSMCTITPEGYSFLQEWGSARYNTAAQFMALVYDQHNGGVSKYGEWAKSQMEYLMGDNNSQRCYIVGFNDRSVRFPHHRAASGLTKCEDTREHRHVLYGALVGGPGANDEHQDTTADYIFNEVTIDYNAAFVGACAGFYMLFGDDSMQVTPDFPPVEEGSGGETGGNNYWVEAFGVDNAQGDGSGTTKFSLKVMTDSIEPRTDISVRYFFSVAEMKDPSLVIGNKLYDQANIEAGATSSISGPFQYDASFNPDIYYVEIKWDDYTIANSNKKYQGEVGLYYGDIWDSSNDWSYQDLKILTNSEMYQDGFEVRTDYICVYAGGELVGGIEPDGSTPVPVTTTTAIATTTTTATATATTEKNITAVSSTTGSLDIVPGVLPGDVSLDNDVSLNDLIVMQKHLRGSIQFNTQQELNGDCDADGKVDDLDCTKLMWFLLKQIDVL